ncbi:hypothetical protein ACFQ38_09845 [Sporosarcina contaminans]|uniref:Uncharacterized protein n=1 Tax=Sporosarcina contaminans TaxID=633403 RepID=A0ABW3TX40_9BACL
MEIVKLLTTSVVAFALYLISSIVASTAIIGGRILEGYKFIGLSDTLMEEYDGKTEMQKVGVPATQNFLRITR